MARPYLAPLLVILAVTALSIAKAPVLPINDPALYEYYGRGILHGAHLYSDLPEVKFPSIYLVNALWQLLFGPQYRLHTLAEATVNLASFALFALILKGNRVSGWAWATALFAAVFVLAFPQLDYPQHYAVFFTLLGILLAFRGYAVLAGCALSIATTFWIPALLTFFALLARPIDGRARALLLAGAALPAVALYVALVPLLGPAWPAAPIAQWPGYFTSFGVDFSQLRVTALYSGLGPAIAMLLALLVAAIRRPDEDFQGFALLWSACALAGTCLPPKWSEHYFLPAVPALVATCAAYRVSFRSLARRPIAAVAVLACALFAVRNATIQMYAVNDWSHYVQLVGDFVQQGPGPGVVLLTDVYIPELYLATGALEPSPGTVGGQGNGYGTRSVAFGVSRTRWSYAPQLVVYGPQGPLPPRDRPLTIFNAVTMSTFTYDPVCGGRIRGSLAIFAAPAIDERFRCGS